MVHESLRFHFEFNLFCETLEIKKLLIMQHNFHWLTSIYIYAIIPYQLIRFKIMKFITLKNNQFQRKKLDFTEKNVFKWNIVVQVFVYKIITVNSLG